MKFIQFCYKFACSTSGERYNALVAKSGPPHYTHTYEGPDDMPAHIKAVMIGSSVGCPLPTVASTWEPGKASICVNIATAVGVVVWL